MEVIDLTDVHRDLFCLCLEDWNDEAKEAGPRRRQWCDKMAERGLRAKLAVDDDGNVGGMIQYLPIEQSFADGRGLYLVLCIWVHGHQKGRGDFQKRGMGKALLAAAEQDAREQGATGLAAWGLWLPIWMRASWWKRRGYKKVDRKGLAVLVWKPFTENAEPPRWIPDKKHVPPVTPGKVCVTAYVNGWCMGQNLAYERAKRAAAEFGDRVMFRQIDTSEREAIRTHGQADAIFVGRKQVRTGPPPTLDAIRKLIAKRVRKLR